MKDRLIKNLLVLCFFFLVVNCNEGDVVFKSDVPGPKGEVGEQGEPGEKGDTGSPGVAGNDGKDATFKVSGDLGFYEEQTRYTGDDDIHLTCMLGQSVDLGVVVLRIRSKVGGIIEVRKVGKDQDTLYIPAEIELFLYSSKGNGTYQVSLDGGSWNTKACSPL